MTAQSDNANIGRYRKEYIWGFTQGDPMHYSEDKKAFYELIRHLTGEKATVTVGASFHPYQIINKSGADIWEVVYEVITSNNYCDLDQLIEDKYFFHINPPGRQAFPFVKWDDTRLYHEINPEFSRYVPFLIPYLTYDDGDDPLWLQKIIEQMTFNGNAQEYIEEVNKSATFLMPSPTFIVGFGTYEKAHPSKLIDNYVEFLEKAIKKKG